MTYKPLKTDFCSGGFRFNQVCREGDLAIFHKVIIANAIHPKSRDAGFEVVVVSRHDGYEIAGVKVEPSEVYPSSEKWGSMGWTCDDLFSAENRFNQLQKNGTPVQDETDTVISPPSVPVQRSGKDLNIPTGEFSCKDLAELNNVGYPIAFLFIKEALSNGKIKYTRDERRSERGKPTKLFTKTV